MKWFPTQQKPIHKTFKGWESIQYESSQYKLLLHQHNHPIQRQFQQWWSVPLFSICRQRATKTDISHRKSSFSPPLTMLWIHNQGGARYQIILLEDEKFFCFSHVSLWLSHLLRINFKLTVFIFFCILKHKLRNQRLPKSRLKRHHKSIENIRRKISSWQNYSHRYHLQIAVEKKRKLNIML